MERSTKQGILSAWLGGTWSGLVGVEFEEEKVRAAYRPKGSERPRLLTSAEGSLSDMVASHGLRGRPCAALLEGSDLLIRRLTLPDLRPKDILPALTLELRRHVSDPVEEAEIRYEVLGRTRQGGLELLVASVPRRAVEEARRAVERSGLRLVALTIRPIALRALSRDQATDPPGACVAYLEMGAHESHITILRGGEIGFTRECGIGVSSFVDALRTIVVPGKGVVTLEAQQAEALVRVHGIPLGMDPEPYAEGIPIFAVSVMLRPILERLVREVWNSLDYVHEQYQGEAVSRVRLVDEAAAIPHLAEHLAQALKIPIEPADLNVETPGSKAAPGSRSEGAAALGLALLERGSLNFLEPAGAGATYRIAEAIPQRVAIGAAAVLLLSVSLPAELSVVRERRQVAELERKLQSLEPLRDRVDRFRAVRREEEHAVALMGSLTGGMPSWSEVLRDLSHRVGSEARLTSFELIGAQSSNGSDTGDGVTGSGEGTEAPAGAPVLRITGLVRREALRSERPLGELMESLERSPYLREVRLVGCEAVEPELSRFALTANLVGGGAP
jgi:type IV pilus assembly protein PilM